MVLLFREGMNAAQWAELFKGAEQLSGIQKERSRAAKAGASDAELEGYDNRVMGVIGGELLSSVGYFLLWTSSQFRCHMQYALERLDMRCDERGTPQKGLPHAPSFEAWSTRAVEPRAKVFAPYWSAPARYQGMYGEFALELQLRPEPTDNADEILLKGDAVIAPGAQVLDGPGGAPVSVFRYGYAEVLLSRTPASR